MKAGARVRGREGRGAEGQVRKGAVGREQGAGASRVGEQGGAEL